MKIKNVMCALVISSVFTSFVGATDPDNKELQTQMRNSSEKGENNGSFSLLTELTDYGLHLLLTGTLVAIGGSIGFYCGTSIGLKQGLGEGALDVGCKGMVVGGTIGAVTYVALRDLYDRRVNESKEDK